MKKEQTARAPMRRKLLVPMDDFQPNPPGRVGDEAKDHTCKGRYNTKLEPTEEQRDQVIMLVGAGLSQEAVAHILRINFMVLREVFPIELDLGAQLAAGKVANRLFQIAMGSGRDAVEAQKFWLARRAKWKEVSTTEVTGEDGQPIGLAIEHRVFSDEERATLLAQLFNKLRAGAS